MSLLLSCWSDLCMKLVTFMALYIYMELKFKFSMVACYFYYSLFSLKLLPLYNMTVSDYDYIQCFADD